MKGLNFIEPLNWNQSLFMLNRFLSNNQPTKLYTHKNNCHNK